MTTSLAPGACGPGADISAETQLRLFASWSGGKDSCLALYRMVQAGHVCEALFTMIDETGEHSRSHGLPPAILEAQAQALGLPLFTASATWGDYTEQFKAQLAAFHAQGLRHGVFGDIDTEPSRTWVERVCAEGDFTPHLPLWQDERGGLVREFVAVGFRAIIVVVDTERVPETYLGREIDTELIAELEGRGVDACGEFGEFHTLVYGGPLFAHPITFTRGQIMHLGKHAVLPIEVGAAEA